MSQKIKNNIIGRMVKTALCAGVAMGLSLSASVQAGPPDGSEPWEGRGAMTPFSRIAHIPVVKLEDGTIDRAATYAKAKKVALDIARYIAMINDATVSGFPANWIVGGLETPVADLAAMTDADRNAEINSHIMRIPSPELIDPSNPALGIKKANVLDLCNSYYAKQALGVTPIAGTTKKVVNGYSHAPALPCELSTWNDDENIYVDMLDPNAIFSLFFTDVLASADMQDPAFAEAISALPPAVKSEIKTAVYKALGEAGYKYKAKHQKLGPRYANMDKVFEVVANSPEQSPFKHVAYTYTDGTDFGTGETKAIAKAIMETMSIHGTPGAGTHPELDSILSAGSSWRSARHEPLGLPGKPEKNWVIEACSPKYAKAAMSTGLHHVTALPCEIAVQRVDLDGDGGTESLVISYLDPGFMLGALFADISDDKVAEFAHIPGAIMSDLQIIVQHTLDGMDMNAGTQIKYNMLP